MSTLNFILKSGNNGKNTTLDKAYSKLISNISQTLDEEKEERWETYNLIIEELLRLNKNESFQEIKYRLTDGENPNIVILEVIDRIIDDADILLYTFKKKIEEYIEDDFIKRFYF